MKVGPIANLGGEGISQGVQPTGCTRLKTDQTGDVATLIDRQVDFDIVLAGPYTYITWLGKTSGATAKHSKFLYARDPVAIGVEAQQYIVVREQVGLFTSGEDLFWYPDTEVGLQQDSGIDCATAPGNLSVNCDTGQSPTDPSPPQSDLVELDDILELDPGGID